MEPFVATLRLSDLEGCTMSLIYEFMDRVGGAFNMSNLFDHNKYVMCMMWSWLSTIRVPTPSGPIWTKPGQIILERCYNFSPNRTFGQRYVPYQTVSIVPLAKGMIVLIFLQTVGIALRGGIAVS